MLVVNELNVEREEIINPYVRTIQLLSMVDIVLQFLKHLYTYRNTQLLQDALFNLANLNILSLSLCPQSPYHFSGND